MKYVIAADMLYKAEERIDKFQRKVNKLGIGMLSYSVSDKYIEEAKDSELDCAREVVDIEITGSYKVGEWTFVAELEWNDEAQRNIARGLIDEHLPEKYFTSTECEHCGVHRFRKYTIVLKNDDGEYIQVGKSCVKDFIGVDVENYIAYLSQWASLDDFLADTEEETRSHRPGELLYRTAAVLAKTCAWVREHGYVSKNQAAELDGKFSTGSIIYHAYFGGLGMAKLPSAQEIVVKEEDEEMVKRVIEFVNNLPNNDYANMYINNLKILVNNTHVKARDFGLLVSALGSYLRKLHEDDEKKTRVPSEYIGTVGDKITFTATPVLLSSFESEYGWTYIYKFVVDNNIITWMTGKLIDTTEEHTWKATIKKHEEYRGNKQTVITRAKIA